MVKTTLCFILTITLIITVSADDDALSAKCSAHFTKVMACLPFATAKAAAPTHECCYAVTDIRSSDPACLCFIIRQIHNGTNEAVKSMGIQESRLLQLPSACKLPGVNISDCPRKSNQQPSTLSWSTRLKILKGTARGLAHLHECSPQKFVHGDVKPSKIFLGPDFQPQIFDFGLSRLITITENDPSSLGGFLGGALPYLKPTQPKKFNHYRAPEARVPGGKPTQKWDVYSFGVVLLEMLMGKSPEHSSPTSTTSTEILDLVMWVRKGFSEESPLSDMVDPVLLQEVRAKK